MKLHVRKHLLTCALLAGLGVTAQAQTPPPTDAASGPSAERHQRHHAKHDPAKRAERINKRLGELKQKLQVTPNQETAWTSFANAMQPPAQRQRPDREALARMSTPDRIDHMRVLRDQRNAEMDRRADATKAFYGQLSAEQKKTFDDETSRLMRFGRGMGRHHHG
jgi:periplasmic protein CpxP/Spy